MEEFLLSRKTSVTAPAATGNESILTPRDLQKPTLIPFLKALGLQDTVSVSRQVIKDAWSRLILNAHPDKNVNSSNVGVDYGKSCEEVNRAKKGLFAALDKRVVNESPKKITFEGDVINLVNNDCPMNRKIKFCLNSLESMDGTCVESIVCIFCAATRDGCNCLVDNSFNAACLKCVDKLDAVSQVCFAKGIVLHFLFLKFSI
jgi:hypothetical protein